MNAVWTALIGASTGFLGVLAGWFAPRARSLDSQRADFDKVLESQRKDFEAVLEPIHSELRDLRERIKTLEAQHKEDTVQHFQDVRRIDALTAYVKELLAFIKEHVPSPQPPPIPPEISGNL